MSEEIKDKIQEVNTMLVALKDANTSFEKKYDGILNDVRNELANSISQKLEVMQKETNERLDSIEASVDRPAGEGNKDLNKKEFDAFLRKQQTETLMVKAMRTDSDPDGGYLVRPEFSSAVVSRIFETSPIRRLASVMSGSSDSFVMPIDDDELDANWTSQGATVSESDTPQLGEMTIYTHKMDAMPKLSVEQVQDSALNVESWLQAKLGDKFGRKEATAFVSGTGNGQPKGFLSYTAGSSTYARNAIEQVNSGSAGAVTVAGLVNTQNALFEPYQPNASWLMHRTTFGAILLLKSTDNYHFLGLQPTDRGSFTMSILGQPVVFAADMPVAASASLSIAYGDFRAAYLVYDKEGIEILKDPYSSKGHFLYYTTKRVGGAVVQVEALKLMKLSN